MKLAKRERMRKLSLKQEWQEDEHPVPSEEESLASAIEREVRFRNRQLARYCRYWNVSTEPVQVDGVSLLMVSWDSQFQYYLGWDAVGNRYLGTLPNRDGRTCSGDKFKIEQIPANDLAYLGHW